MYQRIKFVVPPVVPFRHVPVPVEPDCAYFPVIAEQFGQLPFHELEVGRRVRASFRPSRTPSGPSSRGVLPAPVDERVVKVQSETFFMAGFGKFFYDVPSERCRIRNIIICVFRAEHGESVMVSCGEADILCARAFYGLHPFFRIEPCRAEPSRQFFILLIIDILIVEHPFPVSEHRINTPVDENAEPCFPELLP